MPGDTNQGRNPEDPLSWKQSGNEFFNNGQYEEAIHCYVHAIELDPDFLDAWNNMGLTLRKLGKLAEARQCNEKVKQLRRAQESPVPEPSRKPAENQSVSKKLEHVDEIREKTGSDEIKNRKIIADSPERIESAIPIESPGPTGIQTGGQPVTDEPPVPIPSAPDTSNIRTPTHIPLIEGETPIWFGQMSWAANWVWLLGAVVFCWTIILPIIFIVIAWRNVATSEYFISDKRVYSRYGFLSHAANDLEMGSITNTSIRQGFFGRVFNFGDILLATPGTSTGTGMFPGPSEPMKIKGIIEKQISNQNKQEISAGIPR